MPLPLRLSDGLGLVAEGEDFEYEKGKTAALHKSPEIGERMLGLVCLRPRSLFCL